MGVEDDLNEPDQGTTDGTEHNRRRGRPLSTRIPYLDEAKKGKRARVERSKGHETLPRIVGRWFCRNDNESEKEMHRASMLLLLKPWRNIQELKGAVETFEDAYSRFIMQADDKIHRVIANIQYYYECSDGAKADREKATADVQAHAEGPEGIGTPGFEIEGDDGDIDEIQAAIALEEEITEDDIERAWLMRNDARERLYGENAVNLAYDVGFFQEAEQDTQSSKTARAMQPNEAEKITAWESQLKAVAREQLNEFGIINITENAGEVGPSIGEANVLQSAGIRPTVPDIQQRMESAPDHVGGCVERVELAKLNEEQRRAHDIIEEKLKEHLASEFPKRCRGNYVDA